MKRDATAAASNSIARLNGTPVGPLPEPPRG